MTTTPGTPPYPQSLIPRPGARVLLVDAEDRVLMFRGFDPARPDVWYWFTVGGGVDPGETTRQAAARELREETGLALPEHALGEPVWHEVAEFPFDGRRYRQEQDFFLVRVPRWEVETSGWDEIERRTVNAVRWWTAAELDATGEQFYPADLPALLRRVLAEGAA